MIHTGLIANDYKQTDDFHLLLKLVLISVDIQSWFTKFEVPHN